jgi:hypothetical protein
LEHQNQPQTEFRWMISLLIPGKVSSVWEEGLKPGDSPLHVCFKEFWLCQKLKKKFFFLKNEMDP